MNEMAANPDSSRFLSGAEKYAAYLETPEGRLRLDLAFANLQEFLPQTVRSLRALDLGCGTGAMAMRLARLGIDVTLLDSSLPMLDIARHAAQAAGIAEKIELKHGEADELANLLRLGSFDIVVCHNLLEYVEDPCAVLRLGARALRDRSAVMSVLVRNQAGEVLKAAIQAGDLALAGHNLTTEWGDESLYGGRVRLFTPDRMKAMLEAASLTIVAERGVRVVSDYLPPSVCRTTEYERILELERKLGMRPEIAAAARYTQYLVRCADPRNEDGS